MLRAFNSKGKQTLPIIKCGLSDISMWKYSQHMNFTELKQRRQSPSVVVIGNYKYLHTTSILYKEPESKVDFIKENIQKITPTSQETQSLASSIKPKQSLWQKIVHECKHYYNGFKLLYLETRICVRLLKQVLRGHTLTRRERKQLTTTSADLFRLVPFSVFVIVPFLEFTLPIFLKLFPNMLPSTFKEESQEQEKLKKRLKAKLEVAKFLQDTLEETSLTTNQKLSSDQSELTRNFAEFMKKIRSKGVQPTSEEILKYSSLFENELTLDNLTRQQLIALCQILDVSTYANIPPNEVLRFQLRTKMRTLEADDHLILNEGLANLTIKELQQACRERGMRALGISEERLRRQLEQWIDLHINQKIPSSLLILSRALYLTENIAPEEAIKTTLSKLPEFVEKETMLKIAESSGTKVDNTIKLEILKKEEEELKREREWIDKLDTSEKEVKQAEQVARERELKETLVVDKADERLEFFTPKEMKQIGQMIEDLSISTEKQVKEDLDELKKDVSEYKQDLREVETITEKEPIRLTETKSAKILSKRVGKLIGELDTLVEQLQQADAKQAQASINQHVPQKNMVSIEELLAAIHKIQGVSNEIREEKIKRVLLSLDRDRDGKIDDMSDVVKVFELISEENVKVTKDQLTIILNLLEKEKILELEEEQKAQQKKQHTQQ